MSKLEGSDDKIVHHVAAGYCALSLSKEVLAAFLNCLLSNFGPIVVQAAFVVSEENLFLNQYPFLC